MCPKSVFHVGCLLGKLGHSKDHNGRSTVPLTYGDYISCGQSFVKKQPAIRIRRSCAGEYAALVLFAIFDYENNGGQESIKESYWLLRQNFSSL
jgi:hypothetical protein